MNFGPQTVTGTHIYPVFGRLHFGPKGVLPLKYLHALEINQGLLAHTPRGGGPKNFNREHLKFGLKFHDTIVAQNASVNSCHVARMAILVLESTDSDSSRRLARVCL